MKEFLLKHFSHLPWLHSFLGKLGYQLVMVGTEFQDVPNAHKEIFKRVKPYTMTSEANVYTTLRCIEYLSRHKISGDIVECGVWRGGMMMAAALALNDHTDEHRKIYLYDTFEGMAEPTAKDDKKANEMYEQYKRSDGSSDWCRSPLDDVRKNLLAVGFGEPKAVFVKGKVEDTIPDVLPEKIALLRLDTDWYESTKHEFTHLYPKVMPGGIVIIDDYGAWQGSRKATDEFLAELPQPVFLHRIDAFSRIFIKPF